MKYHVFMKVHATAVVEIEADSKEEAIRLADEEYAGAPIGICHQCSDEISDPSYGDPVDATEGTPA